MTTYNILNAHQVIYTTLSYMGRPNGLLKKPSLIRIFVIIMLPQPIPSPSHSTTKTLLIC